MIVITSECADEMERSVTKYHELIADKMEGFIKEKLLEYGNDYDAFIDATGKHYVEVQLWTDRYITKEYLIM